MGLVSSIFDTLIGTGGWVGAVALAGFLGKNVIEGWLARNKDKREEKTIDVQADVAAVGNMSTVNAIMTKSIESLHSENVRLASRNEFLEKRNEDKDKQIAVRDETIDRLKAQLEEWVARGQQYVAEITTYQQLLAKEQDEVE